MTTFTRNLTIFEGPDGSGKSTAAQRYAEETGAKYVHFPALPRVSGRGLARMYVEAMLPALYGYQDVVFDRCWLSEEPYGSVFRPDQPLRTDEAINRMLDRVAMRCGAQVIYCLPPLENCLDTFRRRKGEEMLDREDQLVKVYNAYEAQLHSGTHLPVLHYDFTQGGYEGLQPKMQHQPSGYLSIDCATAAHRTKWPTAGNLLAPVCIVGESFAERKDTDNWEQFPFVSFGKDGCSHWLASYLSSQEIGEEELCWANSDFVTEVPELQDKHFIALGATAAKVLDTAGLPYTIVPHPQHQKRFKSNDDYQLGNRIRAYLDQRLAGATQEAAG